MCGVCVRAAPRASHSSGKASTTKVLRTLKKKKTKNKQKKKLTPRLAFNSIYIGEFGLGLSEQSFT